MRIISWNCNGAFRKKFKSIEILNADIYIIQECENPAVTEDIEYKRFADNHLWIGYKNKGLGIFAKDSIALIDNHWETFGLEWFISCTVNGNLTLLGIWGSGNYIEDIYVYLQIHKEKLKNISNVLLGGDFNSNSCWDKEHKRRTHSAVVKQLGDMGLNSCYHEIANEVQGQESQPTFYLYRNKEKFYHIDYFFYDTDKLKTIEVGNFDDWISLSDHMPIVLDIDDLLTESKKRTNY